MTRVRSVVSIQKASSTPVTDAGGAILDHLDGLYRFALRLTRNVDDAQELAQETVLHAWQQRQTITRNVRAWLFQTLYHAFVSRHRRRGRLAAIWLDEDANLFSPLNSIPAVIDIHDVRTAIEGLPVDLRIVVWLSDAEGMPLREIAQTLDWPLGTVASRLWRARQKLRIALSAYGPSEEKQA